MTDKQITGQLSMVTTPVLPPWAIGPRGSKFAFLRFNLFRLLQQACVLLLVGVFSLGSYYAVSHYFLKSVKVVGSSMVPTLQENSNYLLNLWTLRNREPQRNDIVVIRDPADHGLSVKRVVAVAGESILFKEGKVFVDGDALNEPYLLPRTRTFTYSLAHEQLITCGKGQYFVLGDNRRVSIDSRAYGPVSREDVLGLVEVR